LMIWFRGVRTIEIKYQAMSNANDLLARSSKLTFMRRIVE
jgi:hypothetical protein